MMRYYLLRDDVNIKGRWHLAAIDNCDNWRFSDPPVEFMEPCTYCASVKYPGVQLDYSLAGYASVPVVSETFKNALSGLAEVDEPYYHVVFEPVKISNTKLSKNYFVMIIETQLDCVDESKSEFKKYVANDPVRPDRAGEYSAFFSLIIDPEKVEGKHIFRLKKHLGAIIVSEEVKRRLEQAGVTGAIFESVSGGQKTVA